MNDQWVFAEIHRLNKRVDALEDKALLMGALWDGQRQVLLERIIRLEEHCQTNTETNSNTTSSSTPEQGKRPTSMRGG